MNPISLKGLVGAVENALDITMDVEVSPVEKATWYQLMQILLMQKNF